MVNRVKSKKRSKLGLRLAWLFAVILMLLSVGIRWLDIGRHFRSTGISFQVEVLNGTGEDDLARKTTRRLRMMGVDVLIEGNAESFDFKQSILVDRKGNEELMKDLSRRLGCERVIQQIRKDPRVDVTFIIGSDIHKLKIGKMDIEGVNSTIDLGERGTGGY